MANETRTYLLEFKNGKQKKITVPADWKVTFGPLVPGSKTHNGSEALCLRLYETKERQRAVFTNVASFRDVSIPVQERVTHTRNERAQRVTPDGVKDFTVQAEYSEWREESLEGDEGFSSTMRLPKLDDDDNDIDYTSA